MDITAASLNHTHRMTEVAVTHPETNEIIRGVLNGFSPTKVCMEDFFHLYILNKGEDEVGRAVYVRPDHIITLMTVRDGAVLWTSTSTLLLNAQHLGRVVMFEDDGDTIIGDLLEIRATRDYVSLELMCADGNVRGYRFTDPTDMVAVRN